jgi:hypothetical protein
VLRNVRTVALDGGSALSKRGLGCHQVLLKRAHVVLRTPECGRFLSCVLDLAQVCELSLRLHSSQHVNMQAASDDICIFYFLSALRSDAAL